MEGFFFARLKTSAKHDTMTKKFCWPKLHDFFPALTSSRTFLGLATGVQICYSPEVRDFCLHQIQSVFVLFRQPHHGEVMVDIPDGAGQRMTAVLVETEVFITTKVWLEAKDREFSIRNTPNYYLKGPFMAEKRG